MSEDMRAKAAQYDEVNPTIPDDLAFYQARLPSADVAVLELGCGTGRVLLTLAAWCGFIQGIDRPPAMRARCLQKVQAAAIPPTRAQVGPAGAFVQEHTAMCNTLSDNKLYSHEKSSL